MSRPALSALYKAMTKKGGPPPVSGTPTAPSVKQVNGASNANAGGTLTTLSNVVAGDLILVWASAYDSGSSAAVPNVQDSTTGSFANNTATVNTYTVHTATAQEIGLAASGNTAYMVAQGWHTIASGAAITLTVRIPTGSYRGIIAVNMGQVHDAGLFDDGGTRKATNEFTSSLAPIVNNDVTTYSHDYVIAGITHYDSGTGFVADANWPILLSIGDSSTNRMAVVGKAVTAIGDYDPVIGRDGVNTRYAFIGYVIKGKNV